MADVKEETGKNVKCSFCGEDAYCEPCKAEPAKAEGFEHMCYDCHQKMGGQVPENVRDRTHVCIPPEKLQQNFERFMNDVTARAFSDMWDSEKKKLKEMSKQELAQAAFFEGASFMFQLVQRMSAEPPKKEGPEGAHSHEGHAHEGHEHGEHEHEEGHKHAEHEHKGHKHEEEHKHE